MADMIYRKEPTVRSESIIFDALNKADHTTDWTVFYSLYVPVPGQETREIDFLVIIPEYYSIICLEAKGGSHFPKSPHDQVETAMWKFKEHCQRQGFRGFSEKLSLACAVAFTDMNEPTPPPEHRAHSIWSNDVQDRNKLCEKLKEIAKSMYDRRGPRSEIEKEKAKGHLAELQANWNPWDPKSNGRNRIFSSDLNTLRKDLIVPTDDQLRILRSLKENPNHCYVINGAAGTGKTVLAMELARQRCKENGEKVALICSNPYLSSRFERWTRTLSKDHNSHLKNPFAKFVKILSEGRSGIVVAGIRKDFLTVTSGKKKFNYLIVDEAQNMCDENSLSLMDKILEGGLTYGHWTMFGDFVNQKIANPYLTETGEEVLKRLQNTYPRMIRDRLEINCRNTCEIAAAVSMFLPMRPRPRRGLHGPLIQTKYFKTPTALDHLLDDLVTDFKDRKFDPRQIILLSSSSDDFNTVPPRQYGGWQLLNVQNTQGEKDLGSEDVLDVSGDSSKKTLRYSNIHDFQGLESEVVILVLPLTEKQTTVAGSATFPDYDPLKRVLYVGMSRAKAILIIVAEESYKEHLNLEPHSRKSYEDRIKELITQSRF